MASIHCLGAGLVGSFVIEKLKAHGHQLHVHDIRTPNNVEEAENVFFHIGNAVAHCDELEKYGEVDLVVNLLPGDIGHEATKKLIDSGRKIVDLSFCEKTPDRLHDIAKETGASVLWDVGIAPGLSNMLIAYSARAGGGLISAEVRVGGNPTQMDESWSYMAPFSPHDVIAEYTRPARIVRERMESVLPALSERHRIKVEGRGEMEAFLTDGLRSLLDTIPADDMAEYTVRWPGHIQRFIDERKANRIDYESLIEEWKFDPSRGEFTWMKVNTTCSNGESFSWIIEDEGDEKWSSMARTTGLVTAHLVIEWLNHPEIIAEGVYPPESLPNETIATIIQSMKDSGVSFQGPDIII